MKPCIYEIGDMFCIPLPEGGHQLGLVGRTSEPKGTILAFVFSIDCHVLSNTADVGHLGPDDAALVGIVGDLGLIKGEWRLLGRFPNWRDSAWPMPEFVFLDEMTNRIWRILYDDMNPLKEISRVAGSNEDISRPRAIVYGYKAFESLLQKRLLEKGK